MRKFRKYAIGVALMFLVSLAIPLQALAAPEGNDGPTQVAAAGTGAAQDAGASDGAGAIGGLSGGTIAGLALFGAAAAAVVIGAASGSSGTTQNH